MPAYSALLSVELKAIGVESLDSTVRPMTLPLSESSRIAWSGNVPEPEMTTDSCSSSAVAETSSKSDPSSQFVTAVVPVASTFWFANTVRLVYASGTITNRSVTLTIATAKRLPRLERPRKRFSESP